MPAPRFESIDCFLDATLAVDLNPAFVRTVQPIRRRTGVAFFPGNTPVRYQDAVLDCSRGRNKVVITLPTELLSPAIVSDSVAFESRFQEVVFV